MIAVADALRYGMAQHGIPLIYYSDNGGGEKNLVLDADITGFCPVWVWNITRGYQVTRRGAG
ncbi:hypothetical protein ACLBOM_38530 [Escherichia coli]